MSKKVECQIFVAVNEEGNVYFADDAENAASGLAENYGGACCRTIKIVAKMTPPQIEEVTVDIPEDDAAYAEALAVLTSTSTMTERKGA